MKSVRIVTDKPTVYITFEKFAEREPNRLRESDEGVFLRLHNNTRWSLVLQAYGGDGKVFAKGTEEEVGMFYGVEEVPDNNLKSTVSDEPRDIRNETPATEAETKAFIEAHKYDLCTVPPSRFCHACSVITLPPGKSLVFGLPRETLCGNLKAYIAYQYDWEDDWGGYEPEHRVYFYGSGLPKVASQK